MIDRDPFQDYNQDHSWAEIKSGIILFYIPLSIMVWFDYDQDLFPYSLGNNICIVFNANSIVTTREERKILIWGGPTIGLIL